MVGWAGSSDGLARDAGRWAGYEESPMQIKVIYYLDVISSWCYWAEAVWDELKERYGHVATFEWRIALMDGSGMPVSRAQEDWFYRRSGVLMGAPFMLNGGWMEPGRQEYLPPNLLAEAAKVLGVTDDRVRRALAEAGLRQGLKIGQWPVAGPIAAYAAGIEESVLLARARTPEIESRVRATTAEFHAMKVTQRPTFVIEDAIEDRAVFSGLAAVEPLAAAIEAMRRDCAGYAAWKAHFGDPPTS